ncbi:hypothetical protein [Cellulomonas sp. SLBN-39]|uniref:hypothetical protein n=1 Tax=Cellulomonas sp. SLBN-39 TaxID=2768446 RepID=UPI0011527F54|nr:hypothetical protein [Cellulomonas sp. SLBN-39]TQL01512.1 hypothetical protein FBY24_0564 [Cellulomonas sp. SLBN-39]
MTAARPGKRPSMAPEEAAPRGRGWVLETSDRRPGAWVVRCEHDRPLVVIYARRSADPLPPDDELAALTRDAVGALLRDAGVPDVVGWTTRNVTNALMIAARDVASWEGDEWQVEPGGDPATSWATPADGRTPFAWLRARGSSDTRIGTYQDDGAFGLSFVDVPDIDVMAIAAGELRPRTGLDLARGRIHGADVVLETGVEGARAATLLTEVLLHGDSGTTLLVAAEAYSRSEWRRHDESVVAVRDLSAADVLPWSPPRPPWRPPPVPT